MVNSSVFLNYDSVCSCLDAFYLHLNLVFPPLTRMMNKYIYIYNFNFAFPILVIIHLQGFPEIKISSFGKHWPEVNHNLNTAL